MSRAAVFPTYIFIAIMVLLLGVGFIESLNSSLRPAPSSGWEVVPVSDLENMWTATGLGILVLRAFSSGAVAVTGVESISSAVQYLKKPRARNASTLLLMMGLMSASMLLSVIYLVHRTGAVVVLNPDQQLKINGQIPGENFYQTPLLGQLAQSVFGVGTPLFYVVICATVLVLVAAASTAFSGFPSLASKLARDSFLPRQLKARGDRFAFTYGVFALLIAAALLVVAFGADVNDLIQLYVVGVFASLTITQLGMVRHWKKQRRHVYKPGQKRRTVWPLMIAYITFLLSAGVLIVVLGTKFIQGAWITVLSIALLSAVMFIVRRHYDAVDGELELAADSSDRALPSRVHAMIIVPSVRKPTMRALAYARASRPSTLEALVVDVSPKLTEHVLQQWQKLEIPVPVTVLDAPYRNSVQPVIDHLRRTRRRSPRDLFVVYIPEYVVGSWWEKALHNQSTRALAQRLRLEPGVMIASVPWHIDC